MFKRHISFLLAGFFVFSMTGCASILTDDTALVNIGTTNGKKVAVKIDGVKYVVPAAIRVEKDGENKIILAPAGSGCAKQTLLKRKIEKEFFINILTGGTFGSSTDMATDKMWAYEDTVVIACASKKRSKSKKSAV